MTTGSGSMSRLALAALSASVLILLVGGRFVDWNVVFLKGMSTSLNDQAGYISLARNYAERGLFETNFILSTVLRTHSPKLHFYLPGHYGALAVSYRLFGYSPAHSFWPSLGAFIGSAMLMLPIASRLFGRDRALAAWALFVFFPANLIYAFTAMAEMTVIASVTAALALFLILPQRLRSWTGPAVLVLPLLFRETGVVIAVLMAGLVWKDGPENRRAVARFALLSILLGILVLASPLASGRPSLLRDNLFAGHVFPSGAGPGVADWVVAIGRKFAVNTADLLAGSYSSYHPAALEVLSVYSIVAAIPISFIVWRRTHDALHLSILLMLVALVGSILCLYMVWWYRGLRILLLAQPFAGMMWVEFLSPYWRALPRRALRNGAAAVGLLLVSAAGFWSVFRTEPELTRQAAEDVAFLESMQHNTNGLLVSPWEFSLDYTLKHHPAKWATPPDSDALLKVLNSRFPISTLLLASDNFAVSRPAIASVGLSLQREVSYQGRPFLLFQRVSRPTPGRR